MALGVEDEISDPLEAAGSDVSIVDGSEAAAIEKANSVIPPQPAPSVKAAEVPAACVDAE